MPDISSAAETGSAGFAAGAFPSTLAGDLAVVAGAGSAVGDSLDNSEQPLKAMDAANRTDTPTALTPSRR
ncbi:hypothetical protein NHF46_12725 [Arthrobacter alpinus]|nr:hypothetical protein [Arthrobacter alpinus]